nr:hypothetical protein [Anaerolineae bacterium]
DHPEPITPVIDEVSQDDFTETPIDEILDPDLMQADAPSSPEADPIEDHTPEMPQTSINANPFGNRPPTPVSRREVFGDTDIAPPLIDQYADENRPATPNTREKIFGVPPIEEAPPDPNDDTLLRSPFTSRSPFSKDKGETPQTNPRSRLASSLSDRMRGKIETDDTDQPATHEHPAVTSPSTEATPPTPTPTGVGRVGGRRITTDPSPSNPPSDPPPVSRKRIFSAPPPVPTETKPPSPNPDPSEAARRRFSRSEGSPPTNPTTPPPTSGGFTRRMTTGQEDLRPRGPRSQPPSTPSQSPAKNQTIPLPIILPDGQQIQITQQQLDQLIAEKGSYSAALEYLVSLNRRDDE